MAPSLNQVLGQLQRWTAAPTTDVSDAALLQRYIHQRDEAAFAALVARHGTMVLRVCQHMLGDNHGAEDAFQAAFVVLARKAASLRRPEALAAWLHGVARRVALKARSQVKGRCSSAASLDETLPDPRPDPLTQLTARELLVVVDEEVQRLPSAQRSAVVLCCLEGQTRQEAARQLGWTLAALKSHLQRGRQRLQERLARRGIALPAALALVAVSRSEAVSALLLRSTVTAALSGGIGSSAAALAHSVLKTMLLTKLAGVMTVVLTVALAASATVAVVYRTPVAEAPERETLAAHAVPQDAEADKRPVRTDALGDPLPDGAIARLGTVRFRHGGNILMIRFTPDGKRLVSHGEDGVRVWDAATGKEWRHRHIPAFKGQSDLSPDGKCLVSASSVPSSLELWDVDSGKRIATFGEKCYAPIRFSPDGKLLATRSAGNKVEIWQVESKKKLRSWKVPAKHVGSLTFSADSRRLLTDGLYDVVRVWEVTTGKELQDFLPLASASGAIRLPSPPAISADGKLVALLEANSKQVSPSGAVAWKTRISLRDMASQKLVRELTCPAYEIGGEQAPFRALMFTPDGKSLVTSGPDRNIRFWDAETGKEQRSIAVEELPGALALSPDGTKLAVVMGLGTAIRILDLKSGQATTPSAGHLMPILLAGLTPDGRTAVTGSLLGPLFVWDAATGRVRRRLENRHRLLDTLQLGGDGQTLFTSGWDKTVRVCDMAGGTERRRLPVECYHSPAEADRANRWLVVTPDGKTLAAMDVGKTIRILDAASGAERQHFQGPKKLLGMGLTLDGRSLIAWSDDFKVRVWDTASGRKLREFSLVQDMGIGDGHIIVDECNFALSQDGRLLAMAFIIENNRSGDLTSSLILKDLATGQVVHHLGHLPWEPSFLAFSMDNRMLAFGFKDSSIRLLETASGGERRRLAGHRGRITVLAFSADGRRLLSGCNDTTALVWDLAVNSASRPAAGTEMQTLWNDLAGGDASRAHRAIHRLAASPSSAIPFMRKYLRPVAAVEEKRLARLIADLDSDDFATREKAGEDLARLREQAVPAYGKALESKPSLEARRRLDDLLDRAQRAWWDVSGERLRSLRAVEALELAGTKEAWELLKTLAVGAEGARLTEEAKAALQRLASREGNASP